MVVSVVIPVVVGSSAHTVSVPSQRGELIFGGFSFWMFPRPIVLPMLRLSSSANMGVHEGGLGFIVARTHLIFGVCVLVSMSGSPIPLSSLGFVRVLCAIALVLSFLKKVKVALEMILMCSSVGVWNCAW